MYLNNRETENPTVSGRMLFLVRLRKNIYPDTGRIYDKHSHTIILHNEENIEIA